MFHFLVGNKNHKIYTFWSRQNQCGVDKSQGRRDVPAAWSRQVTERSSHCTCGGALHLGHWGTCMRTSQLAARTHMHAHEPAGRTHAPGVTHATCIEHMYMAARSARTLAAAKSRPAHVTCLKQFQQSSTSTIDKLTTTCQDPEPEGLSKALLPTTCQDPEPEGLSKALLPPLVGVPCNLPASLARVHKGPDVQGCSAGWLHCALPVITSFQIPFHLSRAV